MNRLFIGLVVLGFYSVINLSYGEGVYPDLPEKHLPLIKTIPNQEGIILETRTTPLSGDPLPPKNGQYQIEVGLISLANKSESVWDLPPDLLQIDYITCLNSCNTRASWASRTGQLLLALHDSVFLINRDGSYKKLNLKVPEHPTPIETMESFAITQDAQIIAYHLVYREPNDKLTGKSGAYNADLIYQKADGSEPGNVSNAKNGFLPDWSPDKTKLAFVANYNTFVVSDLNGRVVYSAAPPFNLGSIPPGAEFIIDEVRWSPNGDKVGFIVVESYYDQLNKLQQQFMMHTHTIKHILFSINSDGSDLKKISIGQNDIDVNNFAWSPSGTKIVFRSSYEKEEICGHDLFFLVEASHLPCRVGYHLFTSNIDGSELKRVSKVPEFRKGELFWIQ